MEKAPFWTEGFAVLLCENIKACFNGVFFRIHGLRTASDVDDCFLASQPNTIEEHETFLISTLESLGWTINYKKSSFVPEDTKEWIRYIMFSSALNESNSEPRICIKQDRIWKLRRDIVRALRKKVIPVKTLARIAGQCVSMAAVILPAKLLLRNVYRVLARKKILARYSDANNSSSRGLKIVAISSNTWNWNNLLKNGGNLDFHRRVTHRLGSMDPGPASRRRLERETPKHAIKLQRADCSFHGTPLLFASHKRKVCSNSIRQYFNGGLSKSPGRFSTGSFGHDKSNQNWTRENNFVNPSFRLIPQVIEFLKQQKGTGNIDHSSLARTVLVSKSSEHVNCKTDHASHINN